MCCLKSKNRMKLDESYHVLNPEVKVRENARVPSRDAQGHRVKVKSKTVAFDVFKIYQLST